MKLHSDSNLHSRNTIFWLKKVFQKGVMEMKVWV